jgi:hypothetical protein
MVKEFRAALVSGVLVLALAGCEEEGPAERAGKRLDNAMDDMRNQADDAGEEVEEALEDAQRKFDEAMDAARRKLNDADN